MKSYTKYIKKRGIILPMELFAGRAVTMYFLVPDYYLFPANALRYKEILFSLPTMRCVLNAEYPKIRPFSGLLKNVLL